MRWVEWGPEDGAPVLCVHGLTRNGRDFDILAQALAAEGRRVICPDLPGRGESDWLAQASLYQPPVYVGALAHLLARIDAPWVDWVGTSLGGICGMLATNIPGHHVRRMVLNDVGALIPKDSLERIRDYVGTDHVFADVAALEAYLRRVHASFGTLSDAEWRHLADHSNRRVEGGVALHYDPAIAKPMQDAAVEALDLWAMWEAITVPVLLIRGAESDLLPADVAARMATRDGVRLVEISDAGHAPALMAADQVALVAGFLRG
ncbi:alpha/beta hydrolase [Roseomonas arctica]|uniref:Alpha/beta hydrolase n=2 Tax=Plastoroseomonas arctica TaxID=1509237 RepID=A0AAF1KJG3_9PROT|nr:alpha/beta hydrolase [Plastoroseomonas arctica]MBR0655080.1 alpha/beta hydrolase [Plastoroseomonas arctica]